MGKALYIHVAGNITTEEREDMPPLEDMQKFVKGYVEFVSVLFNKGRQRMIVNEEGLLKQMPINWKATSLYHANAITQMGVIPDTPICGPAILLIDIKEDED